MSDLISIITPAYNAATYLAETIASVQAQTYQAWEMIIVDDGSTDNTAAIVHQYTAFDARIKYIYQANGRQGKARNNGLAHAIGSYIAFLDADDLWLPSMLDTQLQQLKGIGADLVFSDTYLFSDHFDPNTAIKLGTEHITFAGDTGLAAFLIGNRIPILTVLCKRAAVNRAGGFTENLLIQNAEDYHLWLKMLLTHSKLIGLNHTLAAYRRHAASVSTVDGLNHSQGIEARYALVSAYPEKQAILQPAVRHAILANLVNLIDLPDATMYRALERYLEIGKKTFWLPLFSLFQKTRKTNLAIRSAYFIFNYL